MQFIIETAKKSDSRARIALCGPSGAGKTYTALQLARGLTDRHERIVLIDTENRSAAKYADGAWKQLALPDNRLPTYVAAIEYAQDQADVLIVDSISHAWAGPGGALEQADQLQKKVRNKMEAWRQVTPQHNRFVEAMVHCRCHLIVTMRTRTEWVFEQDKRGKTAPRKIGTKPVQRDGIEYEFDIVCDITAEHDLLVSKTRCPELDGAVLSKPGPELGGTIAAWLSDVDEPAPPALPPAAPELSLVETPAEQEQTPTDAVPALDLSDELKARYKDVARALLREFGESGAIKHPKHAMAAIDRVRRDQRPDEEYSLELLEELHELCRVKYRAREKELLESAGRYSSSDIPF